MCDVGGGCACVWHACGSVCMYAGVGGVHVYGVCVCMSQVCVCSALPYFQSQYVPGAVCTFLAWILGPAVSQSLNYFFKIGEQY